MERRIGKTAEKAMRLEFFLKTELGLTGKQIRQAKFRENGITVNGERSRITTELKCGDFVEVLLEETQEQKMVPAEGTLSILYEDEDLLILDKPAGIVVHPSHGHYGDSILNLAAGYYEKKNENVMLRVIGRLDKETSGVLVLAKNQVAAARLTAQKETGVFQKEYLAVPVRMPEPECGTIRKGIKKADGFLNKMMAVESMESRNENPTLNAVTHYEPYGTSGMLRIRLETGRTHQIRVHMASIGCPLCGDSLYGTPDSCIGRTALHAWKTTLVHPFSKEKMEFTAEIPADFVDLFRRWKNPFDKQKQSVYNNDYVRQQSFSRKEEIK